MGVLVFFVLFAVAAAAIRYFQRQRTDKRNGAVEAIAMSVNFDFSFFDPSGIAEMPFRLFGLGRDHKAQRVIWGTHNGLPLQIFDYEYVTGEGRSREVHLNTCAILSVPAACPPLCVTHDNALMRLEDHLVHQDVQFEYDDFNRRFRVNCENQKFAFSLLDAQMMEWMLATDSFDRVEIVGPWVLIARRQLDPALWLSLGNWLDAFHTRIPPIVYTAFPPR